MEIKIGQRYFSKVFGRNVDVTKIFKNTVSVKVWGGAYHDKLMTFRGQDKATLAPRKTYQELKAMGVYNV